MCWRSRGSARAARLRHPGSDSSFAIPTAARNRLATGTDVCSAARGAQLPDRRAAARAGLALARMHEEAVLEGALGAVHVAVVVDRGALGVYARLERRHHRLPERLDLRALQGAHRPQWMDAGAEERLVGVDVAHARHALLGEQERLHRLLAAAGERTEGVSGEVGAQRLDAEPRGEVLGQRVATEQYVTGAEPAHVDEQETLSVVQVHDHPQMPRLIGLGGPEQQG